MIRRLSIALLLLVSAALACCTHYTTAKVKEPVFRPAHRGTGSLIAAEKAISDGLSKAHREPLAAIGSYLNAAETASQTLTRDPQNRTARDDYNFAIARIFSAVQESGLDPWTASLIVPAKGGDFVLTYKVDTRQVWDPALYDFISADQVEIGGKYMSEHIRKEGIGASLVAVGRGINAEDDEEFTLPRTYYGVTAVAHFSGRHCEISFEDPLKTETVNLEGHILPLAADYTAPIAMMLTSTNEEKMAFVRFLDPEKYANTTLISCLQPYDPDKAVILVIHGLNSSPSTWTPMINSLRGDEKIRRHYQVWCYSYPSGYPYPYSAALLRKNLDALEKKYPLRKKMVVIGHSMGGCISRLLITDSGDKLWTNYFGKPPAQTKLSPKSRELFSRALIFNHRPEVGRVIFICAPLRGSDFAVSPLARLSAKLIKEPAALLQAGNEGLKAITFAGNDLRLKQFPNSVDDMAPNHRFVKSINAIPITAGIQYHTIMGDRGKGGHKDHTNPVCSDGFVPYWSSHLDGAQSELIVPSNHSAHQTPQAIAEVKRILLLQANAAMP